MLPPRFVPRAYLGAGGFGSVWLVYDREREALVALKMMREWQPRALHRFKQEFRELAGLVHPNLVTLYELVAEEPLCFFTMEFVQGIHFLAYVCPGHETEAATVVGGLHGADWQPHRAPLRVGTLDETRLRESLWQLVAGVEALHESGRLHRDIKPSNVLIAEDGRLVLLDFGLVKPMGSDARPGEFFVGTPQYMSPEQAMGHEVGPATDWYSVGAMLYEALCGQAPIEGITPLQVVLRKQSQDPVPVWQLNPDAPADLAAACMALLRRDPATRASGAELRGLLRPHAPSPPTARVQRSLLCATEMVGRVGQLRTLHQAASGEGARCVMVRGRSGMGKSLLVRTFLRQLRELQPGVLVLEGRCYEHEAVPYKALDGVVEQLCDHLERERGGAVRVWLQELLGPLVRLFPTAARLGAAHGVSWEESGAQDSEQRRLQGFEALRELLARLSRARPVVLYVDDAQWGDEDSAALLEHVLDGSPSLLCVLAWRVEDEERSSFVRALGGVVARAGGNLKTVDVVVDRLSEAESRQLVTGLFGHSGIDGAMLARVTREAEGSPFMLDELARYVRAVGDVAAPRSIGAMIAARVDGLSQGARQLLEVVAVAGQPVERGLARQVAQLDGDEPAAIARLRNELMVRVTTVWQRGAAGHLDKRQTEALEIYHDRIREAVCERMGEEALRAVHLRLAQGLESRGADGEVIARHYIGAGMEARAVQHVLHAAEQAADALAFDRAASLYALALRLGTWGDVVRRALITRLAEMYSYLGRVREAADAYLQAVGLAQGRQALELERQAAEQLLRCGAYEEGEALLGRLLEAVHIRRISGSARLQAETLALRAKLVWQGSAVRLNRGELSEQARFQLELCWTAAHLLSATSFKAGAYYGARYLLLARQAGDPGHLARAMALEAIHSAGSEAGHQRARELIAQARALAPLSAEVPYALSFIALAQGVLSFAQGSWREAEQHHGTALDLLRRECRGVTWESASVQLQQLMAQEQRGELSGFMEMLPVLLDEANRRQDGYHGAAYRIWSFRTHLMFDAPHRARQSIEDGLAMLPRDEFLLHHMWYFYASVNTALYEQQSARAWTLCMEYWPQMKRAQLMGHQLVAAQALDLRARSALGAAEVVGLMPSTRKKLMQEAEVCAERLGKSPLVWAQGVAQLVSAQLIWMEGDRARTILALQRAEELLERSETLLPLCAARMWRGQLLGGRGGAALVEEARRAMRERHIRSPERTQVMLCPAARISVGRG